MPTRDIVCLNCGFKGMMDSHNGNDAAPKVHLFKHLEHNLLYSYLHYRCPVCEIKLLVDPTAFLEEKSLKGLPNWLSLQAMKQT